MQVLPAQTWKKTWGPQPLRDVPCDVRKLIGNQSPLQYLSEAPKPTLQTPKHAMSSLSSSPVHLLSKKSRKLHRDTFFFVPHFGGPLLGGELALNSCLYHMYRTRWQRSQGSTNVSPQSRMLNWIAGCACWNRMATISNCSQSLWRKLLESCHTRKCPQAQASRHIQRLL